MEDMVDRLKRMEDGDLVRLYGAWYEEMKTRGIVRTRNIVGEVGEYYAVETYRDNPSFPDLEISRISMKHFDATSQDGRRYSVKTVTSTSTGVFYGLNAPGEEKEEEQLFDHLILVRLNKDYTLAGVYEMDWSIFLELKSWHSRMGAWKMAVNKHVLSCCVRVDGPDGRINLK